MIVTGQPNNPGYRDGYVDKALFNQSRSLAFYQSSQHEKIRQRSKKAYKLGIDSFDCKFANGGNITSCEGEEIESTQDNNNYVVSSNKTVIPEEDFVDERTVKWVIQDIYPSGPDVLGDPFVFVADTGNHCI